MRWSKPNIYYAFFFTPTRLVAAKIGTQTKKMLGYVVGGALGYYLAGEGDKEKRKAESLQKASIKSILEADKDNFEIPYSEITTIEINKPTLRSRLMSDTLSVTGVIKIVGKNEQKFQISREQNFEDCVNIVRQVLPDKLMVK